jgi:hypothetical protein
MQDHDEQTPSARDEQIYTAWESGKTLRVLAREMGTSVAEVARAIDRCLPPFNTQTQMQAYKRELQKLEDAGTVYHTRAMQGDLDGAHVYARINERYCAMRSDRRKIGHFLHSLACVKPKIQYCPLGGLGPR